MSNFPNTGSLLLSELDGNTLELVVKAAMLKRAETLLDGKWVPITGDVLSLSSVYRIAEHTLEIPWSLIHRDFRYATVDCVDNVFVHTAYPRFSKGRWNSDGDIQILEYPFVFDLVGVNPETSLIYRPEGV